MGPIPPPSISHCISSPEGRGSLSPCTHVLYWSSPSAQLLRVCAPSVSESWAVRSLRTSTSCLRASLALPPFRLPDRGALESAPGQS